MEQSQLEAKRKYERDWRRDDRWRKTKQTILEETERFCGRIRKLLKSGQRKVVLEENNKE